VRQLHNVLKLDVSHRSWAMIIPKMTSIAIVKCRQYCRRRLPAILMMLMVMVCVEVMVLVTIFGPDQMTMMTSSLFQDDDINFQRMRRRKELLKQQNEGDDYGYDVTAEIKRFSKAMPYKPFPRLYSHPVSNATSTAAATFKKKITNVASMNQEERRQAQQRYSKNITRRMLENRGLQIPTDDPDYDLIPPWWKIVDNYYNWKFDDDDERRRAMAGEHHDDDRGTGNRGIGGSASLSSDERPLILGMDRCQAYRDSVPAKDRAVGAAGLFSSGTNLVADLVKQNCEPPTPRRFLLRFANWQVPWGKRKSALYDCLSILSFTPITKRSFVFCLNRR
jgi:hypothetical protein